MQEFGWEHQVVIEDYCILGVPPRGASEGEMETILGAQALVRSHTVIYAGNIIGNSFQTGNKVNIRELNRIGDNVSVGTLSVIEHHVEIGNNVRIHSQAFIPEFSVLEDDAWIGPNVVLTNAKYPLSRDVKESLQGPRIKRRRQNWCECHDLARCGHWRECSCRCWRCGRQGRPSRGSRSGQPGTHHPPDFGFALLILEKFYFSVS